MNKIWVEKYRPQNIEEVIFRDNKQKKIFQTYVSNRDIPNLLLSGVQGTGKTTVSKALIKDLKIDPADVLRINCSDEKIDAMRNKVSGFATSLAFGRFKIVQLEEFDYLSIDSQALLRSLIEDTSSNCRFIATCNYINRIIPPLRSRFQEFEFKAPEKERVAIRMAEMLEAEQISYDPEILLTYVDVAYPDIRKTIQLLQGNSLSGELLNPKDVDVTQDWRFALLDALEKGDFKSARKIVCESTTREEHEDIYRFLYEHIDKLNVADKDSAIVTIADYLYRHTIVADTEINLAAAFIALSRL